MEDAGPVLAIDAGNVANVGAYAACNTTAQCADGLTCGDMGYCAETCSGLGADCSVPPTGAPIVGCNSMNLCETSCGPPTNGCPAGQACMFPIDIRCRTQ